MLKKQELSLAAAFFVNVNIMLGSGVFINSVTLARAAGALGALVYPLVGLLILPLIIIFSLLLANKPGGTFFEFGSLLHPVAGFLSSWGYFVGKLASAALGLHIFVTLMQSVHPGFAAVNALVVDAIILGVFVFLTLFNVKTGRPLQYSFFMMKIVAVTTVLVASARLWDPVQFVVYRADWWGIPSSVTFGIFAFAGFEATCSLSKNIQNPSRNGPRAVIFSYLFVMAVLTLYQLLLYGALGSELGILNGFQESVGLVISRAFAGSLADVVRVVAFVCIASSALGSSYAILYSNLWNLNTLAQYQVIPWASLFKRFNKYYAPIWCVLAAGAIELGYLLISKGEIILLQQVTACASTLAYALSVFGFCALFYRSGWRYRIVGLCGVGSILLFAYTATANAWFYGVYGYSIFALLLLVGLIGFWYATVINKNRQGQPGQEPLL
ncbi:MAG: APC family permease [Candidatus Babeliaceae bacterium]|nr:APC family permease [Candidatus Babeliaceae bacterium]